MEIDKLTWYQMEIDKLTCYQMEIDNQLVTKWKYITSLLPNGNI